MWFKYGLKAQKLLAQGVWGETCETSVFQRKRQFLTKLPLSLVFHKQKCIKTAIYNKMSDKVQLF